MMRKWVVVVVSTSIVASVVATQYQAPRNLASDYLAEFEKFLHEEPVDGRFGISRLPTIHERTSPRGERIGEVFDAMAKDYWVSALTLGEFGEGNPKRFRSASAHWKLSHISTDMVGLGIRESIDAENRLLDVEVKGAATKLWDSGQKARQFNTTYGNREVIVSLRKVSAPRVSCLNCHTNVPRGKAIGVAGVILVAKKTTP
jgi:hypothetical protein